jgi:hypothetical protein
MPQLELYTLLAIVLFIANEDEGGGAGKLKWLSQDWGGRNSLKVSGPHPLMKTYRIRMTPLPVRSYRWKAPSLK